MCDFTWFKLRRRKGPPSGKKAGKIDQGLDGDQLPVEDKGQPVRDERFPNGNEDEDNGKDDSVDGNLVRHKNLNSNLSPFQTNFILFRLCKFKDDLPVLELASKLGKI